MPASETPSPKRFVLYLPKASAEAVDGLIPAVELLICRRFGGLTSLSAVGMYENKNGTIQREEVVVIECYGELETWSNDGPLLFSLARTLGALLKQESIGCSVDGRFYVVEGADWAAETNLGNADQLADALCEVSSAVKCAADCPW